MIQGKAEGGKVFMRSIIMGLTMRGRWWLPVLLVASLLPFLPFLLDPSQVLLYRDLSETDLPAKTFWLRSVLEHGMVPRWNFLQGAGAPFYADLVAGPLYPLNALLLLFGIDRVPQGLTVMVMAHYPLQYLGYYFLFRHLGLARSLAAFMGLAGATNGFAIGSFNLTHVLSGVTALPWFTLFWLRAQRRRQRSYLDLLAASLCLAWPIYGGDPQFTYVMALGSLLSIFAYRRPLAVLANWAALGFFSLLAAGPQLLPSVQLYLLSNRNGGPETWPTTGWAVQPVRWWELLVPNLFGSFSDPASFYAREQTGLGRTAFFINSIYLGSVPVLLGAWSLVSGHAWSRGRRRRAWLWAVPVLLFGLFVAMGGWAPVDVYGLMARYLPMWAGFRYPERTAIYPIFLLLLWTGLSLRGALAYGRLRGHRAFLTTLGAALALLLGLFTVVQFSQRGLVPVLAPLREEALVLVAAVAALALAARSPRAGLGLLALVAVIAHGRASRNNIEFQPVDMAYADTYPITMKVIRNLEKRREEIARGAPDRLLSFDRYSVSWWHTAMAQQLLSNFQYGEVIRWEGLAGNIASYYGIPSVQGHYSVDIENKERLVLYLREKNYSRLIDVLGARYLIQRSRGNIPEAKVNLDALPNFFFLDRIVPVASPQEAVERLEKFPDIYKQALVVKESSEPALRPAAELSARLVNRGSASVEFAISTKSAGGPAFFVFNETSYAPWRAEFEGQDLPIRLVNGWAMGVRLPETPAGLSRLRFYYRDPTIFWGQVCLGLWLLLAVLAFFWRGITVSKRKRVLP